MPVLPSSRYSTRISSSDFQSASVLFLVLLTACSTLFVNDLRSSISTSSRSLVLFSREQSLCSVRSYGKAPDGFLWSSPKGEFETRQKRYRRHLNLERPGRWNEEKI